MHDLYQNISNKKHLRDLEMAGLPIIAIIQLSAELLSQHQFSLEVIWIDSGAWNYLGVEPKNRSVSPKMDGENHGKPYESMDDLGGKPLFLETPT